MAFWQWKTTAALNANSDPSINMAEGMPPAQLNDGVRALMARAAENRDDTSGLLLTTGTSTAYAVTTNQGLAATPNDGQLIVVSFHVVNGTPATLSADSGTAFPIQTSPGFVVVAGVIAANVPIPLKFRAASSAWIMLGAGVSAFTFAVNAGAVTNAGLANAPAWTLKGNNSGSSAAPTDFTIDALTVKAAPLAADEVLIWDAAGAAMKKALLSTLAAAIGAAPTVQRFTSGSGTYTPTAGTVRAKVTMKAGGGGGGGQGIGPGAGGTGGTTSFGSWTAIGGTGGSINASNGAAGGTGGANGTGTLIDRIAGSGGGGGTSSGGQVVGGIGGGSGGAPSVQGTNNGIAGAANTGGGGSGAATFAGAGSSGGGQGEFVSFWLNAPTATSFTVGPAGSVGAGTIPGGAGGSGGIVVEEFYI
jgi:hypothetical protein